MYGVLWRSKNLLDGESEYLMYKDGLPLLFVTKKKATEWIRNNYGYIARRKDLRQEPHGWRMPQAVRLFDLTDKRGCDYVK